MTLEISELSNYEYSVTLDSEVIGGLVPDSLLKWRYVSYTGASLYSEEAGQIRDKLLELNE